jgi:hypothetical protein
LVGTCRDEVYPLDSGFVFGAGWAAGQSRGTWHALPSLILVLSRHVMKATTTGIAHPLLICMCAKPGCWVCVLLSIPAGCNRAGAWYGQTGHG